MTRSAPAEVTFVLPDKLGGVAAFAAGLLAHRKADGFRYGAVLTDNVAAGDVRMNDAPAVNRLERVRYSLPPENLYAVLRRVARAIRPGPGVLVASDWIELACATVHDLGRTVVAVAHGDGEFYFQLAVRHSAAVDLFVAPTPYIADRLRVLLPDRIDSIVVQPFGVDVPPARRAAVAGPLRLAFIGRLHRDKGIFDLPDIDRTLCERSIAVTWTILGSGPDERELRDRWLDDRRVRWTGRLSNAEVLELVREHDVLVLPSRGEGLPVSMLECGAAGVVPVVSDLPSGVPDVVEPGVTGFRPAVGDIPGFADAIARLAGDRARLDAMSRAVRDRVAQRYDAGACTAAYQALFARWRELKRPRPRRLTLPYGSRLDRPWIPNPIVKAIRSQLSTRASRRRPGARLRLGESA